MDEIIKGTAPESLIGLLREQRDLYQRLQELSDRQRSLIAGDRPELLLNILRDRQTLVESLARINQKLSPFRRNWQETYESLPADVRQTASSLLDEINGMLQLILKADQEDQALLSARKQAVARSLSEVSGGQLANSAYAPPAVGRSGGGRADVTG